MQPKGVRQQASQVAGRFCLTGPSHCTRALGSKDFLLEAALKGYNLTTFSLDNKNMRLSSFLSHYSAENCGETSGFLGWLNFKT